jgi:small subunit ribosomal protein S7e
MAPKKGEQGKPAAAKPAADNKKPAAAEKKQEKPAEKAAPAAKPAEKAAAAPAKDNKKDAKPAAAAPAAAAKPAAAAAKPAAAAKGAAAAAKPKAADAKPKQAKAAKEEKGPHLKKISKPKNEAVTELESQVAKALFELEAGGKDLAADLAELFITSAKAVDTDKGKQAIVVFVPFRLHGKFKKIQARLLRELEKKLGKHVVLIAQRTILAKSYSRKTGGTMRPRSRTLTTVQESILDDIVYPTLIVGKRQRTRADASKILKVHLDSKDAKDIDYKLKTFAAVYKKLTNKPVEFVFPDEQ